MHNPYHQTLLDNPSIMLRLGEQNPITQRTPLNALDAIVGGVARNHPFIVTSANADYLPAPSFGNTESVYMREDYRYGAEDHTQWPQVYLPMYGYHICIERRDLQGPLASLWATPSKASDFDVDLNVAHGIGLLSSHFFLPVQMAVQEACDEHLAYETSEDTFFINRHHALLVQFELNLQHTRLPYHRALLTLRLYQRTALELRAYQWYMRDIQPIITGKVKQPVRPLPVKSNWMGSPVWIIREAKLARSFRCLQVVQILEAGDSGIVLHEHERAVHRLPPLFDGSPTSPDKYCRMQMWTAGHVVNFQNPYIYSFTSSHRPSGPLPLPSTESRPVQLDRKDSQGLRKRGASPYKKTPVFRQPYHLLLPRPVSSWVKALEATEEDFTKCYSETIGGYFVPRPETFVSGASDAKRGAFIRFWLRLRPVVLSVYDGPDVVPVWRRLTLSHQAWRTWLLEKQLDPAPVRANPKTSNGKKEGRVRDEIAAKVAELRAGDPTVNIVEHIDPPAWHEEVIANDPPDHVEACREILWDVGEMGFRLDLMRLDGHLSTLGSTLEHYSQLQGCFRAGNHLLTSIDLGMANTGLAEPDWMTRAPFVWSFKQLMMGWTGTRNRSVDAPCPALGYNMEEFELLEFELVRCYIETFFAHFRRAPSLPLQLSHLPRSTRVNFTPPEVRQRPPQAPGYWKPLIVG